MDALKEKHRAMWASGDYPSIAEVVAPVSENLVRAAGVTSGQRVLDVASGTGSSAIPAAAAGAEVTASDLTPEFFELGREAAADAGVELEWVQADAEDLPFEDASFDVVMSAIGVMFAPHHEAAAAELLRVTKPGGTIAVASWTPEGAIGQMFKVMKPYAPPPPPGAQPPPLWGSEDHVRGLLGDGCSDLSFQRHKLEVTAYETTDALVEHFTSSYGPTLAVLKNIGDDEERRSQLLSEFAEFAKTQNVAGDGEPPRFEYEYVIAVGRRA